MKIVTFLIFYCFLIQSTFCQVKFEKFSEYWDESVNVSGGTNVGLLGNYSNEYITVSSVYVLIPENKRKYLNLELISIDGVFTAEMSIKIDSFPTGIIEIPWNSKYLSKLKSYKKNEVAILGWFSETALEPDDALVVCGWDNFKESKEYYVLVNSKLYNPYLSFRNQENGKLKKPKCIEINKENTAAYDCYCKIKRKLIANESIVKVIRRRFGSKKTTKFKILFNE